MSASFEKSVKSATKIKLAPPKAKWVERILMATRSGEAGVAEVFRILQYRLRDNTWTISFKALIVVHLMIREGAPDVTLRYLSTGPKKLLGVNNYTDVQTQGRNIRHYSAYLIERAKAYANTKVDVVQGTEGRLKKLSVDKGLLRETESVQSQIQALLKCDLLSDEPENEISLTAFRLLTLDLLALFGAMNEAAINVLEHYFEMSKPDAERALAIYKTFAKQTDLVVRFLSVARQYEYATRLEIPKINHAPTSLSASLEDYLHDKDFETNRRQYIAEKEAKKTGGRFTKPTATGSKATASKTTTSSFPETKDTQSPTAGSKPATGPSPDLIDFFESIEQNQQPMQYQQQQQQPQPQYTQQTSQLAGFPQQQTGYPNQVNPFQMNQTGFASQPQQNTNPFGQFQQQPQTQQIQSQPTGAGFGGYTPQPQPQPQQYSQQLPQQQQQQQQPSAATYNFPNGMGFSPFSQQQPQSPPPQAFDQMQQQQQQASNPFRQSMMPTGVGQMQNTFTGMQSPTGHHTGNPFARSTLNQDSTGQNSFTGSPALQSPQSQPFQQTGQSMQSMMPQRTGTNPFARSTPPVPQQSPPPSGSPFGSIAPNPTGSTNPFKQSAFVNQQTGQGWQQSQGTMGGLENLETISVFPRPAGAPQQMQQSPWQ